ncbi:MAG: hypothetical protein ACOYMB_02435 [Patescibacteria group bacterium]
MAETKLCKFTGFSKDQKVKLENNLIACGYSQDEGEFFLEKKILEMLFGFIRQPNKDFYFWFDRIFGQRPTNNIREQKIFDSFSDNQIYQLEDMLENFKATKQEFEVFIEKVFLEVTLKCMKGTESKIFSRLFLDYWDANFQDGSNLIRKWSPAAKMVKDYNLSIIGADVHFDYIINKNKWFSSFHQHENVIMLSEKISDNFELVDYPESLLDWTGGTTEEKFKSVFGEKKAANINLAFHLLNNRELIPGEWRGEQIMFLGSLAESTEMERLKSKKIMPIAFTLGYRPQGIRITEYVENFGFVSTSHEEKETFPSNWGGFWKTLSYEKTWRPALAKIPIFK